jgi:quinol monooxygenase YgiN
MKLNMNTNGSMSLCRVFLIFSVCIMTSLMDNNALAQEKSPVVHLAKLQIDPVQLESYKAALKEHIETAVRVEPGVLTLYAVSDKDNPASITVFEIYADTAAYKSHLQSPHFKKYKSTTKDMVKSLELIDVTPIALGAKPKS